jgi:hypothetical protein
MPALQALLKVAYMPCGKNALYQYRIIHTYSKSDVPVGNTGRTSVTYS